nr:MAG TPA: hypothetical protein [Caudoviricetes sp.]DAP85385.1 MAG TPA: hypothetical protein [Caudoviricetes sp.]
MPCENNTSITDILTFARGVREIWQKKLSNRPTGP